uniref:Ribonuclease H-like n=1 Tax=Geotrypetes seraphini TaxID=260995 RepID=A0A6P8PLP9_GEOSA|nr:ribonuclease H-like [Geotrypetes seraphini]
MQWVMSDPKSNRVGYAQEQSKWKWYISQRAKIGEHGVATLHEKIANIPNGELEIKKPVYAHESPVKWGVGFDNLTSEQQKHAWFTDGSAKYVGGERKWKSVAYNPKTDTTLVMEGKGMSSQYAELMAVVTALRKERGGECHLFTDSWSVANGLATWLMGWKSHNWLIHGKELWGKELWQDIEEIVQETTVSVFHVDAHMPVDSMERLFNSQADAAAAISVTTTNEIPKVEEWLEGTAIWAHQKSGHLGEKATYRWAQERGIPLTIDVI